MEIVLVGLAIDFDDLAHLGAAAPVRRIDRALDLATLTEGQSLDGIGREEHVGRLRCEIPLRGTQESKALFGHLQPAFHDDRLALGLRRIATPVFAPVFALIATPVFTLAATLIIAPLLVVATIAAASSSAAAALIVALTLMAPMSLMVTAMTSPAAASALTEAALAAARTEGALMPLLTLLTLLPLWPALLGIALKPGGLSSGGA